MSKFDYITRDIKEILKGKGRKTDVVEAGQIVAYNDGVIMIEGLKNVKNDELIYLAGGNYALAMNLEENRVGAIVLTDGNISAGDIAYTTGRIVSVPVGDALLGRVVDALGEPLDGGDDIKTSEYRNIENPAPEIFDRGKVSSPLYTGIKAIDSMIPIGKGQRELIIGDSSIYGKNRFKFKI